MAVPHNHSGQDRLVSFLQELWRLPPHSVQYISAHGDAVEHTSWEDDRQNDRFCQSMRLLDHGPAHPPEHVNFSAFLARVLARGVVDTTRFCALVMDAFLGLRWPYNKQADRSAPCVLAAAQWMEHAGAALWELCEKKAYAARGFNLKAAAAALRRMTVSEEGGSTGFSIIEAFGPSVKDWEDEE
ncbi:hypothetical protein PG994_007122 [Apiospora phragmitis]|uniref:Uncharacterized protein n=1 Tax=Apiospora phragmitis TaxID=2905665 RepID=A0ABR1UZW6_9PEZI